jgi:stage II sporulation protein E
VKILREENHITSAEFGTEFCAECPKASAVAENFNRVFASSVASACAAQKTNQLRRAVADSFGAMADILGEIGAETAKSDMFLPSQTSAASDTLGGLGMNVISACCKRDGSGHIILTAKITELPENAVLREATNALSKELGATLALPAIRDIENGVELIFSEKPRFCFEIGSDQRPGSDDGDCGDCYDCVGLEDGRNVIILSDGMGTGRRAAVDSAMATDLFASLICSGLSCEAALRTVNTALIAKSEDESLATLDIASLDPYSGEISFFKAGAAPCFIKRSGRTAILELPSLPAGILSRIGFSKAGAELREGDTVVMISDGVAADGSEWITKLIRSWRGDAQGLAEELTAAALSRRKGKKSDDMTAICVRIHSADRIGN